MTIDQFLSIYEPDVQDIASQYLRVGEPLEDMLQDGRIGLIWAFNQAPDLLQDPEFVRTAIRDHITTALSEHGYTLQLPRRIAEQTNHHPVLPIDNCPEAWLIPDTTNSNPLLLEALEQLTCQQRQVINLLYGLEDNTPRSTREVALLLNITQNAVQRIRRRALDRLYRLLC